MTGGRKRERIRLYWIAIRLASAILFLGIGAAAHSMGEVWSYFLLVGVLAITPLNVLVLPLTIWTGYFVGFCPFCGVPHVDRFRVVSESCQMCGNEKHAISHGDFIPGWTYRRGPDIDGYIPLCENCRDQSWEVGQA